MTGPKISGFVLCAIVVATLGANSAFAQQAESDVLMTQATLVYDDQQYDKALSLLDRVLTLEPTNVRANLLQRLGVSLPAEA